MSLHLDTLHTLHVGRPINEFKCNSTKSGRSFDEKYLGSSFPALFFYPEENENDKGIGLSSKMVYITWNITLKIELNVIYDFFLQTAVFETQCSGSGCTFNGCESSGSDTCDGQMFLKLKEILSSINNIWKKKPKVIGKNTIFRGKWYANVSASWIVVQIV